MPIIINIIIHIGIILSYNQYITVGEKITKKDYCYIFNTYVYLLFNIAQLIKTSQINIFFFHYACVF